MKLTILLWNKQVSKWTTVWTVDHSMISESVTCDFIHKRFEKETATN